MGDDRISDEAVEEATGRDWAGWFEVLDAWDAADREHAAIARHLADHHDLSGWWSQMVTVQYERARGLRDVGETASGRYQVGAQRTLDATPDTLWDLVTSARGLEAWLGKGAPPELEEASPYELADGTSGEVRVVRTGSHVRLTWQPPGWERHTTLQIRVVAKDDGRAVLSFHQEDLPSQEAREAARGRWRAAIARLAELL